MPVSQYTSFCSGTVEEIRLGFNFVCLGGAEVVCTKFCDGTKGRLCLLLETLVQYVGGVIWMSMRILACEG